MVAWEKGRPLRAELFVARRVFKHDGAGEEAGALEANIYVASRVFKHDVLGLYPSDHDARLD